MKVGVVIKTIEGVLRQLERIVEDRTENDQGIAQRDAGAELSLDSFPVRTNDFLRSCLSP